jgi:hypothetical protein
MADDRWDGRRGGDIGIRSINESFQLRLLFHESDDDEDAGSGVAGMNRGDAE